MRVRKVRNGGKKIKRCYLKESKISTCYSGKCELMSSELILIRNIRRIIIVCKRREIRRSYLRKFNSIILVVKDKA